MINDILVSDAVVDTHFVCNLQKCKGNCCQEGDYGAPVELEEMDLISQHLEHYKSLLPEDSVQVIEKEGAFDTYSKISFSGTRLKKDGSCVFLIRDESGIAKCSIELADQQFKLGFKKPISCHLYPIRVSRNKITGFHALNYDEWEICNPACNLGAELKQPLYKFVREALIRKFGADFYAELDAAANYHKGI